MLYKDVKLEKRADDEPKFNSKNKTDRKILLTVIIAIAILLVILGGLIALYYAFFAPKANPSQPTSDIPNATVQLIKYFIKK